MPPCKCGPALALCGYCGSGYLVSQNGNFTINAQAIRPSTQAGIAAQIQTYSALKAIWDFHPEMTEGGACKGSWVARF